MKPTAVSSHAIKVAMQWNRRQADLNPPLGYPGGPCYLIDRILSKKLPPKTEEEFVQIVERGGELDKPENRSHLIYDKHLERKVPGTQFEWLGLTSHAQYRMDLRGITVQDIKAALMDFQKEFSKEKSRNSPWWARTQKAIDNSEEIQWVSKRLDNLLIGFKVMTERKVVPGVFVQTIYFQGNDKPSKVKRDECGVWGGWTKKTPLPSQLEKLFEGKTGSLYLRKALKSGPEPVTTFVTEKSDKNLPTDQDREKQTVLPLPGSATPGGAGRDIPKFEYNTPGPGSDISERPRTLGVPGEQYGVPYKEDYNMPTRRTMTSSSPELFDADELEDLEGDPWALADSVGVNILRNKDFRAGYQVGGVVVAALFDDSNDPEEYSFDIVVSPQFQKLGLGKKLLKFALDSYSENKQAYGEDYKMKLDVVNPVMESMLRSRGFKEVGRERGITLMEKQASRVAAKFLSRRA